MTAALPPAGFGVSVAAMSLPLHCLPDRTGGAAENMAVDFLLLQRYPQPEAARFRHYEWRGDACTFGFGQKIDYVRAHLPGPGPFDLCRRPTGGGIVDHRADWTYALVVPRAHALYDARAPQAYREVHQCLADALAAGGEPVELKATGEADDAGPTICFHRAEQYDVLHRVSGAKVAGAAMKRNKHGLLLQGSIEKSRLGPVNWDAFAERFAAALARLLGTTAAEQPWPDLNEDEVSGLVEQYSAPEWIEYR